jgi:hypothetical protein
MTPIEFTSDGDSTKNRPAAAAAILRTGGTVKLKEAWASASS